MAQAKKLSLEFLTIVVGVLTALAVDAWYSNATERALGEEYLTRIAVELGGVHTFMERIERGSLRQLEASSRADPFFDGVYALPDPEGLVQSVYNMGRDLNDEFDTSTYSDLISTGSLRLIEDPDLRAAVQRAYASVGRVERQRRPNREQFEQAVRGWIPQHVVDALREDCVGMSELGWTCPEADFGRELAVEISSRWKGDDAVVAFRLRTQGLSAQLGTTRSAMATVETALSLLEAR